MQPDHRASLSRLARPPRAATPPPPARTMTTTAEHHAARVRCRPPSATPAWTTAAATLPAHAARAERAAADLQRDSWQAEQQIVGLSSLRSSRPRHWPRRMNPPMPPRSRHRDRPVGRPPTRSINRPTYRTYAREHEIIPVQFNLVGEALATTTASTAAAAPQPATRQPCPAASHARSCFDCMILASFIVEACLCHRRLSGMRRVRNAE